MNSQQNIDLGIKIALASAAVVTLTDANRSIKDFLTSNFVIFVLVLLVTFKENDNILVSIALAFFTVILVRLITTEDYESLLETFELIYPGPTASVNCTNIKKEDLIQAFNGSEQQLKKAMFDSHVPMNLELNDANAPEIATYLANNPQIKNIGDCKLVL